MPYASLTDTERKVYRALHDLYHSGGVDVADGLLYDALPEMSYYSICALLDILQDKGWITSYRSESEPRYYNTLNLFHDDDVLAHDALVEAVNNAEQLYAVDEDCTCPTCNAVRAAVCSGKRLTIRLDRSGFHVSEDTTLLSSNYTFADAVLDALP